MLYEYYCDECIHFLLQVCSSKVRSGCMPEFKQIRLCDFATYLFFAVKIALKWFL